MAFSNHTRSALLAAFLICLMGFPSAASAELRIDGVYPTLGVLGEPLEGFQINGFGFDENTRISMYLDAGNNEAVLGSTTFSHACEARAVAIQQDTAFVSCDFFLYAVDIQNPFAPKPSGSVAVSSLTNDLDISGDRIYAASQDGSLYIIDASDPVQPAVISTVQGNYGGYGVKAEGDKVYFANGSRGLLIIDAANPAIPTIIGEIAPLGFAKKVAVADNKAYVADIKGLQIIDIADPAAPSVIGTIAVESSAEYIVIDGGYAYLPGKEGMQAIDIRTPESPQAAGTIFPPNGADQLKIEENRLYTANGSGLAVIDISDPLNGRLISSVNSPGTSKDVAIMEDKAYLADGYGGLAVIDISSLKTFNPIANPNIYGADVLSLNENFAYVAGGSSLKILDISNPREPVVMGSTTPSTSKFYTGISVVESTAYMSVGSEGLEIVDVSDPKNPTIVSSLAMPDIEYGFAYSLEVYGNRAYIIWGLTVQIVDISDVNDPKLLDSIPAENIRGIKVIGTTLYLAKGHSGLEIIDAVDPSDPVSIGAIDTEGSANEIQVIGNYAYLAAGEDGLIIMDISDPSSPVVAGELNTAMIDFIRPPTGALDIAVSDGKAYVADVNSIKVVDVRNPTQPLLIGHIDTPGGGYHLQVKEGLAYIADTYNGLVVMPVPNEITPFQVEESGRITLTLPAPETAGHYTLRAFNTAENSELYGAVSFVPPEENYLLDTKAIIIAGTKENDQILDETRIAAEKAYETLLYQGYTHESIRYLSSDATPEIVDAPASPAAIAEAFNTWLAQDPPASELLLFLVDHGDDQRFIISQGEELTAQALDDFLDALTIPVKVVYDACRSGTFLTPLAAEPGQDRTIITSASDENAFFLDKGRLSFSYQFWSAISDGSNIQDAFFHARSQMQTYQTPKFESDTGADEPIRRGYTPQIDMPYLYEISPPQYLYDEDTTATLQAHVSYVENGSAIQAVWAQIKPPDFDPGTPDTPVTHLIEVELSDPDGDRIYEWESNVFTSKGVYEIILYAVNQKGIYSLFRETTVTKKYRYIDSVSDPQTIDEPQTSADLFASIDNIRYSDVPIVRVWAEITGPDDVTREVDFTDPENDGVYDLHYDGFGDLGLYTVMIYAEDAGGHISPGIKTTVLKASSADTEYEDKPDDSYEKCGSISSNESGIQHLSFHDAEDVDWRCIYPGEGATYTIRAMNLKNCEVRIQIYKDPEGEPLTESTSPQNSLDWTFSESGRHYLKISNVNPEIFGPNITYDLTLFYPYAGSTGSVDGTIVTPSGAPIPGAVIRTEEGFFSYSRENGAFSMEHATGDYMLIIEADGYQPYHHSVTVTESDMTFIKAVLSPIDVMPKDVDCNGSIDLADAVLSLKISAGLKEFTVPICRYADISGDDRIGIEEAISILGQLSQTDALP